MLSTNYSNTFDVRMERTGMEWSGSRAGANMATILLYSFVTSPFIVTFFQATYQSSTAVRKESTMS